MSKLLFETSEWDFETIKKVYDAIEPIAIGELGLDIYPNQIEVITAEQMLDAYSSIGMPLMYRHWSFGKHFIRDEMLYKKAMKGLAYEIVINSNPCISYIMEENTMTMQTLVIAHAAFGHNHFFKNNRLFRQWTDPEGLIDYLAFAKGYIEECERKYGVVAVERVLDAAHALMSHGVDRYRRRPKRPGEDKARQDARAAYEESTWNELWTTLPQANTKRDLDDTSIRFAEEIKAKLNLPEGNLLYFIEKNGPKLRGWEREVIRIVRKMSQYFYPQSQTKVMNEGCATVVHHEIMKRLHERGQISDGQYIEFAMSHSNVIFQPDFDDPRFHGWNPYALGFAMMRDIERICIVPTPEDKEWFPDIAGNNDAWGTLRKAWAEHRDDSFVMQYLSPKLMREMRMFHVHDPEKEKEMLVSNIHDPSGYRDLREKIAQGFELSRSTPEIEVVDVDLMGTREMRLRHEVRNGRLLEKESAQACVNAIRELWGYEVRLDVMQDGVKISSPIIALESNN